MKTYLLALLFALTYSTSATAYSPQVKRFCKGDYFNHCSYLDPYSRGVQDCFRYNWKKVSLTCKAVLIKEGFVKRFVKGK